MPVGGSLPVDIAVTPAPALAHLARYDETLHAWTLVVAGLVPVERHLRRQPQRPGQLRAGRPGRRGPAARGARSGRHARGPGHGGAPGDGHEPEPRRARASFRPTGGTAAGALTVTSPTPLPSGTVVSADVTETYTLATGVVASEDKRLIDIVLYRAGTAPVPPEAGTTSPGERRAVGPLPDHARARTFEAVDLTTGTVHLDILAGREGVRGSTGGSEAIQLRSGDAALAIPALALGRSDRHRLPPGRSRRLPPHGSWASPHCRGLARSSGCDALPRRAARALGGRSGDARSRGRTGVGAYRPLRGRAEARGRGPGRAPGRPRGVGASGGPARHRTRRPLRPLSLDHSLRLRLWHHHRRFPGRAGRGPGAGHDGRPSLRGVVRLSGPVPFRGPPGVRGRDGDRARDVARGDRNRRRSSPARPRPST